MSVRGFIGVDRTIFREQVLSLCSDERDLHTGVRPGPPGVGMCVSPLRYSTFSSYPGYV